MRPKPMPEPDARPQPLARPAGGVRQRAAPVWRNPAALPLLVMAGLLAAAAWWAGQNLPGPQWLQAHQQTLQAQYAAQPWTFGLGFFLLFTLLSALALPGCGLLALAAGLCFGWGLGTLLVLLASTVGATLSFLAARHLWREGVRRHWGHRLARIEAGLARDGALFLFSLRLAPVVPYALVNPLMGLSAMPVRQFFGVSLLGMAAGSAAYVQAGTMLGQAQQWQDLLAPGLLLPLAALALLPWAWRGLRRLGPFSTLIRR